MLGALLSICFCLNGSFYPLGLSFIFTSFYRHALITPSEGSLTYSESCNLIYLFHDSSHNLWLSSLFKYMFILYLPHYNACAENEDSYLFCSLLYPWVLSKVNLIISQGSPAATLNHPKILVVYHSILTPGSNHNPVQVSGGGRDSIMIWLLVALYPHQMWIFLMSRTLI